MPDFTLSCPHCAQPLECPIEVVGMDVNCPVCNGLFTVPQPPNVTSTLTDRRGTEPVKHWTVNARMLVVGAPPAYCRVLVEVPKSWQLPPEGAVTPSVSEAVKHAVHAKFPQRPITPITVHDAEPDILGRCCEAPDYCDDCCKAWVVGRPTSSI